MNLKEQEQKQKQERKGPKARLLLLLLLSILLSGFMGRESTKVSYAALLPR